MPDSTDHEHDAAINERRTVHDRFHALKRAEHDQHAAHGFVIYDCTFCDDDIEQYVADDRAARDNGYVLAWNVHPSYLHDGLARNYLDNFGLTADDVFAHL